MATGHEDFYRPQEVKASSNRSFGGVITVALLVIGLWPLVRGDAMRWPLVIAAAIVLLVTLAAPALLRVPNRLWLRLGLLLNRVTSPVVLGFLFYGIVTPMGLLMRSFGKNSLRLRRNDPNESYWIKRDPPGPKPDSLSDQF